MYLEDVLPVSKTKGLPWILEHRLPMIEIPDYSTIQHDLYNPQFQDQSTHGNKALFSFVQGWMVETTHDLNSFIGATTQWSVLTEGLKVADAMQLSASLLRAQHMIGYWIWWSYLRQSVPLHVKAYLERSSMSTSTSTPTLTWIDRLIAYIDKCYSQDNAGLVRLVTFLDVFPQMQNDADNFQQASLGQIRMVLDNEKEAALILHTCQVVVQWLGMSGAQQDRHRNISTTAWDTKGWFVNAILHLGHPGILLLSAIDDAYRSWRLSSLSDNDANRIIRVLNATFLDNVDNVHQIELLDDVFVKYISHFPSITALETSHSIVPPPLSPPQWLLMSNPWPLRLLLLSVGWLKSLVML